MVDDKTLVSRVLTGDMQAFRLLIRQNERLVAHMVGRVIKNREELEEICQDVFMKVYDKLGEFAFQSKLSTWIGTIAYRLALNALRKNKLMVTDIPEEDRFTTYFVDEESPEKIVSDKDMDEYVLKLVDLLPVQYRTVLMLYHVDGMNYHEIGEITEMPEGTVKNYLFRARTMLKEKVKNRMPNEELL